MIRFRCHRCKRPIAAPDGYVGKKVKCPGCMIVTIVPDIPGADAAKARSKAESRPVPPVEKRAPDPLDQLAAAMDGEVETASFDEDAGEYLDGDFEHHEAPDAGSDLPQHRVRVRRHAKHHGGNIVLWIVLLALLAATVVGVVLAVKHRAAVTDAGAAPRSTTP